MSDQRPEVPREILTERLWLHQYREGDSDEVFAAIEESRAELERWMRWPTRIQSIEEARAAVMDASAEETSWELGIFRPDDDALIGGIDVRMLNAGVPSFALGYWLRSYATGHGYMREAVQALTGVLFARAGARRVVIGCDPANRRSIRVAEASGYTFEARMRNEIVYPGNDVRDLLIYAMIDTDEAVRDLVGDPAWRRRAMSGRHKGGATNGERHREG